MKLNLANRLKMLKVFTDIKTIHFRSLVVFILLCSLLGIFTLSLSKFNTTDVIPPIKPINTVVLKKFGGFTVKVKTGLFIKNFPIFDIKNNRFKMNAIVWFEFNPDEVMLETLEKFSFDRGKILKKSPPDIRIVANRTFVKYDVLFEAKSELNYHKFPFEDHRIAIMLSNNFVTPDEMYFAVDRSSFQASKDIFPASWRLLDLNVEPGYQELELDRQDKEKRSKSPKVLYTISVIKASIKKMLVIFLPLFAAIFFSLFTFLMNLSNTIGKFRLTLTAMTALLGYRFVIERIIPQVAYFTTTDSIYLFYLALSILIFSFQIIFTRQYVVYREKNSHVKEKDLLIWRKINSFTFICFSLLFLLGTGYIILN